MQGAWLLLSLLVLVVNASFFPPTDENIQYVGRVDKSDPTLYRFDWDCVHFFASFIKSTSVSITLHDAPQPGGYWGNTIHYDVYIDGVLVLYLNSSVSTQQTYLIASNLDNTAQHLLQVLRKNEPYYGVSGFVGITLDDSGIVVASPARPNKRVEFLGDSITCGWGTMGRAPCSDQPQLENSDKAWAAQSAKLIGADYSVISVSGQGMVRHFGCPNITCADSLPSLYPQAIGMNATSLWDFSSWIPQAVVINLVTNDYGSQPYPPIEVFVQGYTDFVLTKILPVYGKNVTVFTAVYFPGIEIQAVNASWASLVQNGVNAHFVSLAGSFVANGTGCDGHPDVAQQTAWANYFAPILQATMGW